MKTIQLSIIAIVLVFFPYAAFAQPSCPEGTDAFINGNTYEVVCIPNDGSVQVLPSRNEQDTVQNSVSVQNSAQAPVLVQSVALNTPLPDDESVSLDSRQLRLENNSSRGFNIGLGAGYYIPAAVGLGLSLGYDFGFTDSRTIGFGIYTHFLGLVIYPDAIVWDMAPTLLVTTGIFRFSFGAGLGLTLMPNDDRYSSNGGIVAFMFRPELKFHWFVTEHLYLGFNIDLVLAFPNTASDYKGNTSVAYQPGISFALGFKL